MRSWFHLRTLNYEPDVNAFISTVEILPACAFLMHKSEMSKTSRFGLLSMKFSSSGIALLMLLLSWRCNSFNVALQVTRALRRAGIPRLLPFWYTSIFTMLFYFSMRVHWRTTNYSLSLEVAYLPLSTRHQRFCFP